MAGIYLAGMSPVATDRIIIGSAPQRLPSNRLNPLRDTFRTGDLTDADNPPVFESRNPPNIALITVDSGAVRLRFGDSITRTHLVDIVATHEDSFDETTITTPVSGTGTFDFLDNGNLRIWADNAITDIADFSTGKTITVTGQNGRMHVAGVHAASVETNYYLIELFVRQYGDLTFAATGTEYTLRSYVEENAAPEIADGHVLNSAGVENTILISDLNSLRSITMVRDGAVNAGVSVTYGYK